MRIEARDKLTSFVIVAILLSENFSYMPTDQTSNLQCFCEGTETSLIRNFNSVVSSMSRAKEKTQLKSFKVERKMRDSQQATRAFIMQQKYMLDGYLQDYLCQRR